MLKEIINTISCSCTMEKELIVRHTPEKCLKNEILSYTRNREMPDVRYLFFVL